MPRLAAEATDDRERILRNPVRVRVDARQSLVLIQLRVPFALDAMPFDTAPTPYIGVSAATHVAFLVLALTMPIGALHLDLEAPASHDRFVQMDIFVPPSDGTELEPIETSRQAGTYRGPEGEAGKREAEVKQAEMAIEGPADDEEVEIRTKPNEEIARTAGIADELVVNSPWGTSEESIGSDALHALGNLDGDRFGPARGFQGLGLRGRRRGGGGHLGLNGAARWGGGPALGLVDIDVDDGSKRRRSGVPDAPGGELRRKEEPRLVLGEPTVVHGALDPEIVRRVVRRKRRELEGCLPSSTIHHDRRVVVRFTFTALGAVVSSIVEESTLDDVLTKQCITGAIRRTRFPERKGGGIVVVSYPLHIRGQLDP